MRRFLLSTLYRSWLCTCLLGAGLLSSSSAQVLARPGWAGSGVAVHAWWPHAVFYRIVPANFQDSNGDGEGDLAGIAERLGYLQTLGVDALILDPAPAPGVDTGLDELSRAAVQHQLRVLVALVPSTTGGADSLLAAARYYLTQGVAGLWLPELLLRSPQLTPEVLDQLHRLTVSFPGQRILVSAAPPADSPLLGSLRKDMQLLGAPPLDLAAEPFNNESLAQTLADDMSLQATPTGTSPRRSAPLRAGALPLLMAAHRPTAATTGQESILALMLLGSRSAVLLEYGQELGLHSTVEGDSPLMQWTPSNHTPPRAPPSIAPVLPPQPQYQSYHPYVPRLAIFPPPAPLPEAFVSDVPDPRTVPGFTTAEITPALSKRMAANGLNASAAAEDGQPFSLLTQYRRLIEMHRQSPAMNDGAQIFLAQAGPSSLAWVRRPPPGSLSAPAVLAVCNLSGQTLHLKLSAQLRTLRLPDGGMHTLFTSSPVPFEDSDDIVLPGLGAFVGGLVR